MTQVLEPVFTFQGHATWEPPSIVCDNVQGDLNLHSPQTTQEKLKRCLEKNEGKWTGKLQISPKKKSLP